VRPKVDFGLVLHRGDRLEFFLQLGFAPHDLLAQDAVEIKIDTLNFGRPQWWLATTLGSTPNHLYLL
jgi:hypothetical protein